MNLDQALQTFIVESRELLDEMESALLALAHGEQNPESIHAVFRAAHTIKGSAGLFGLDHIVSFTHAVETVLDRMREGQLTASDELHGLLLSCCDYVRALIDRVAAGDIEPDSEVNARGAPLLDQLRTYFQDRSPARMPAPVEPACHAALPVAGSGPQHADEHWHISLRFGLDVLRNGMDPLSFIRYLGTVGEISAIVTLPDAIPAADEMDPESCYLGFEIAFKSVADKAVIENVFEFVRDDCRISILPPRSRVSDYLRLIAELPEESPRIGEILVRCGSITRLELESALNAQAHAATPRRIGEVLVEQRAVEPALIDAALQKQSQVREQKAHESRSIRVDAEKLDRLIDVVGELIIAVAGADMTSRRAHVPEVQECISTVSGLVQEVRDSALQLRMVKIGSTFSRFQRVVYDVAREIGKEIDLVVSGEDTELDKTVVEKLTDPLTHLVRNAIDHGIEASDLRAQRGKPARGTVRLGAYHDSGFIVIEVSDDGGGLKREKILQKAIERGLVEPGRTLTDSEIYDLVFEPGFSTADAVTNLSGRGVGMDVVKRNIVALRGSVQIQSRDGVGTTVTVRLPLTLAIIDGFLISVGASVFIIPLEMIEECVEFSCEPGHDYTNLRGEALPFIRLRKLFETQGSPPRRENIVVVRHAGQKAGIVVDNLLGEFQTVIKPMGKMFSHVQCISGSTILGSGEVALILDVPGLLRQVQEPALRNRELSVAA